MRKSWNRLSSLAQLRFLPGLASDAGLRGRPCRVSIQVQGFRFFGRRARQHPNPPPPEFAVGDQHHTSRVCPFHLVLRYAAILAGVPGNTAEGDRGIKRVWK